MKRIISGFLCLFFCMSVKAAPINGTSVAGESQTTVAATDFPLPRTLDNGLATTAKPVRDDLSDETYALAVGGAVVGTAVVGAIGYLVYRRYTNQIN